MEVHLTPSWQTRLDRTRGRHSRTENEFVQDATARYFAELAKTSETLDRRYDDVQNAYVKLIPGDIVDAHLWTGSNPVTARYLAARLRTR